MLLGAFLVPTLYRAKAAHNDNLFELGPGLANPDGTEGGVTNIIGDGVVSNGPDWSDLFTASGTLASGALATFGGTAAAFLPDDNSQKGPKDNTVFVVSSKNLDLLSAWKWGTSSVPPKDEFLRAYAYGTVNASNSHLVLYTGFERINGTGSSHVDFQFFQDQVHLVNDTGGSSPPCGPSNKCSFAGTRIIGDTLVGIDFTVGGTFPTVSVFEWNGSTFVPKGSEATGCNSGDTICGFTNAVPIKEGPWSSGHIDANDFIEFGLDVTGLFGTTPCISTVFGATRSTGDSITGTLKDFAGPTSFPVCKATIGIAPNAVNEVGATHIFTVTVNKVVAGVPGPVAGVFPTVVLTAANGAIVSNKVDNCALSGTNGAGQCTVSFTSNSAGTVTGTASATVVINGISFPVTTNGQSGNSNPAVKRFVDASITIAPNDVNSVFEQHTFKVTVQQARGLLPAPAGSPVFENVPDGKSVTVTLTDLFGASHILSSDTCANPPGSGTVMGMCTVTFTSPTAGNVTGHASITFTIDGVAVTRSTDGIGHNSGNALKKFVAGSVRWSKVDNVGAPLAGATFLICRTANFNSTSGGFDSISPDCRPVTDNMGLDQDPVGGSFLVNSFSPPDGLRLGTYTVHETVPPPGFTADPSTKAVSLTIASPDKTIVIAFGDLRPILKLTGFGYENNLTSTPSQCPPNCTVSGTTTYTVTIHNYGLSDGLLTSGTLTVSGDSVTCSGGPPCTVSLSGTVAAGLSLTFTLKVSYSGTSGTVITASLMGSGTGGAATYTTTVPGDTLTRNVNGTPATITFTLQAN